MRLPPRVTVRKGLHAACCWSEGKFTEEMGGVGGMFAKKKLI